ncbi:MAG: ABC transporter ATP-binding protein [Lachnospiraceae bacterium]|nr:ABC transporter ATP-binding protein [Lachnospiraceae bacterium]
MENKTDQKYAIEIHDLTKTYGKSRGVSHISLMVEEGDIFGFLGPNGAGKSTTIRSMLGLLHFQKGEIRILSMDAVKQQKEILSQVGYMPSEAMFYPSMKVKDVIRFAAQARRTDCQEEADRICDLLQVNKDKKIEELSLGNRKKVSIVCAMQHKPRLLILDEPTSGLDPLMQEAFFKLILEYNRQGTTCFLSSHVLSEVKRYCKHAAIIKEGRLIRTDTVENLSKSSLRRIKVWEQGREKEFTYTGSMKELIHKLDGMDIDDLLIEEPSLDEIFMHYYEEQAITGDKGGE